jgi:hypothetical protein
MAIVAIFSKYLATTSYEGNTLNKRARCPFVSLPGWSLAANFAPLQEPKPPWQKGAFSATTAATKQIILRCSYTEPFLSYTIEAKTLGAWPDLKALKVGDNIYLEELGEPILKGAVTAVGYGTRFVTLTLQTGATVGFLTIDRNTNGSDGMSDTVYQFEGILRGDIGSHYGGCKFIAASKR